MSPVVAVLVVAALLFWRGVGRAESIRILVSAAQSEGLPGEPILRHADHDAERVRDVLVSLGDVLPGNALVAEGATVEDLLGALGRAEQIARGHAREDVSFLLYFSGHGDRDALHLKGERFKLTDLGARIAAFHAALRIVVTDACRSDIGRRKGIAAEPAFAVSLGDGSRASGQIWLHASADGEAAQEFDDVGGAVFSHYWVSGLRGAADADGDGRVTVAESYAFAYHQTLYRSARNVLQRPAADFDLEEAAPVVLTHVDRKTTAVALPRSADTHYLVYGVGSRTIMAEAWGRSDRPVGLALPPGRYVFQRRGPDGSGAVEISLADGEKRSLVGADFVPYPEETLRRKGGDLVSSFDDLAVGASVVTSYLVGTGQEIDIAYGHRFGDWAVSGVAHFGWGGHDTAANEVHARSLGASMFAEYRVTLGSPVLRVQLGALGAYVIQDFTRRDADRIRMAGYAANWTHRGAAWGPTARLALRLRLFASAFLEPALSANLAFASDGGGGVRMIPGAGAGVSVGWMF